MLEDVQPTVLGDEIGVHDGDVFFGDGLQQTADDPRPKHARIVEGDLTLVAELDRAELTVAELRRDGPGHRSRVDERAQSGQRFRRYEWRVHRVARWATAQDRRDLLGHIDRHALLRLRRRSAEVRGDDDAIVARQDRV